MENGEVVFSLVSWTIKRENNKFYVARTQHWVGKHEWSRPYTSLTLACNAIARNLEREFATRAARKTKFDRRFKRKAA